jgi:hypothetical protein
MPEQTSAQQHSGDWAMTGKVPVARVKGHEGFCPANRKDEAIQHFKTMAGSPGAAFAKATSAPQSCAWFCVSEFRAFRETMKEKLNVQYSFSRDRLGWTSPQT